MTHLRLAAAAQRHECRTKSTWWRVWQGRFPANSEKVDGRDGRPIVKNLF